nr:serine-threonine/tyrosine-protein kinase catalytic domain-containing protein [Tanacetum cinerariifolium]
MDESMWYGYTLDVQRMSRYGIVVHIRFMVYSSIQRLQALEREVEEMADEKMLSTEKLKGNMQITKISLAILNSESWLVNILNPKKTKLRFLSLHSDLMSISKNWEDLKIPFEKIDVATEKFKTCIGRGGYGSVYKGVLSIDGKDTTVAVKRLNEQFGQGLKEFLTEIQLLFGQERPNLISLLGYCDEEKEKIIVYEYAARGSLDRYIRWRNRNESSTTLTWLERLKICADAARGLNHLHNHIGGHRTIIHRDIKSSNILIDENWVAKISDLGLSKLSVTGFGMSLIVSNGCGTHGYCEPEYYTSGIVTKKSDVYSFGIVLFEVLCGRLCIIEADNGFILSGKSVKEYYNKGNFVEIIDTSLMEHMGSYSMTKFSEIAYRCLHDDREQRPSMDIVVKELEEVLNVHVAQELEENEEDTSEYWEIWLPHDYPRLIEMSDIPLNYTTKKELYLVFRHGFLANNGQLWFSTCKSTHGICSTLPATRVLCEDSSYNKLETLSLPESRFKELRKLGSDWFYKLTCRLESYMFSPGNYNYACYLVFKLEDSHILSNDGPIFKAMYHLGGNDITILTTLKTPKEESGSSKSIEGGPGMSKHYVDSETSWVEKRDDGWLEARFTKPMFEHHLKNLKELKIYLTEFKREIILEAVEFRPVDDNGSIISSD